MSWNRHLPGWLSLAVLGAVVIGILTLVGWVKPYLSGPDLALSTIYRPKPVPVKVETVKWLTRTKVKTERMEVPIEVIREVPPKTETRLAEGFGLRLSDLRADNRELVDVLAVPKAPHGGEMALTVNTESGRIAGTFRPKAAPFIAFGGLREVGLDLNVTSKAAGGYYRQDLIRVGPAVVNGKVFVSAPLVAGGAPDFGAAVGVAVRF